MVPLWEIGERLMSKFLCIYHGNCADGFGSAWVVRKAWQEGKLSSDMKDQGGATGIDFVAGVYQQKPPLEQCTGAHVVIVDFSYRPEIMLEISKVAKSLTWIDHHKTAIELMLDFNFDEKVECTYNAHINTFRSGAWLTWEYYFGDVLVDKQVNMPQLIAHIDDRDRWVFKLPYTREIQANLFSYPYDFEVWDRLMAMKRVELANFALGGETIERKHFKDIGELLVITESRMNFLGWVLPCANMSYIHASDAGNIMAKRVPLQAAATYYINDKEEYVFSLRSVGTITDVSAIAKQYGGGGHKNAAGFTVPRWCVNWEDRTVHTKEEVHAIIIGK